jgi:protoporphyrinogen oxidase
MEQQRRDAWCLVAGSWVAYPFQKNFGDLEDAALRKFCASGLDMERRWCEAENFDTYLDLRFGRGIAQTFLRPYNEKLWGPDLSRMSADWTNERLAAPSGTNQHFAERGGRRLPLQADTLVAYPAHGGYGEIFSALAHRVDDLRLGEAAVRIDPRRQTLQTASGQTLPWRRIVSTLPLPILLSMLPNVPNEIVAEVSTLEALPVHLVMVVLEERGQLKRHRVYCASDDIPGHKVVFGHTSSNWLREQPRHGILVEVAGGKEYEPKALAEDTVNGLIKTGLIDRISEVRRVEVKFVPLGYPVPTHSRVPTRNKVRSWLAEHGIAIVGRFAEWDYINADEALARGLEIGNALANAA